MYDETHKNCSTETGRRQRGEANPLSLGYNGLYSNDWRTMEREGNSVRRFLK